MLVLEQMFKIHVSLILKQQNETRFYKKSHSNNGAVILQYSSSVLTVFVLIHAKNDFLHLFFS